MARAQWVCNAVHDAGRLAALLGRARTHQASKALVCAWNTALWVDFNENTLGSLDVHLELACFVQR